LKTTFKINAALRVALSLILAGALSLAVLLPQRLAHAAPAATADTTTSDFHHLVAILQYLEADFPAAVESQAASELDEQRAFAADAIATAKRIGPRASPFLPRLEALRVRVDEAKDAVGVRRECVALVEEIVAVAGLSRSPRVPPDLAQGKTLYQEACAACHAADGSAAVPIAATMSPKPASFLDAERMGGITPYKAFNAIGFGVRGTAMPSFLTLDERQRWAVAFYVMTLRHAAPSSDAACASVPKLSLEQLATSTDDMLTASYGPGAVACLRHRIPHIDEESQLLSAREQVEQAIALAQSGQWDQARKDVLDAYLLGVEPVEALLRARDPDLVTALEASFGRTRVALEAHRPEAIDEARKLVGLLDRARKTGQTRSTPAAVFWFSLLIIVREGFEATVIIAALIAVLKKMKQREQERIVHAGWLTALFAGAIAFFFGQRFVAGANRERVEGIFALVAVAMLLHAAFWLNARANTRRMMGELREKMQSALGKQSGFALFSIAFIAMFRESFETAIFLQGLTIDSPKAVVWGTVVGIVVLVGLVLGVDRLGLRLPMTTLFKVSTVVLFVTAVMLLGKGIHALQEIGTIPLRPVRFVRVDFLGVFPDAMGLVPQAALAMVPFAIGLFRRRPTQAPRQSPPASETASGGQP
jgi:high-affinity iron transporter